MPTESHNVRNLLSLDGRVFLVAGGARNLGRDMALALAEAGADGVVTSRDAKPAQQTGADISAATGRRVEGIALDATDEASVASVVESMIKRFGKLDILVNCVGGGGPSKESLSSPRLEDRSPLEFRQYMDVNVTAPFILCKHVVPHMRARKSGNIINISSIAGIVGRDRTVYPPEMMAQPLDYAAAKGAVITFTRDLAAYVGRDGIRVNCISPGGFERGQPPKFIKAYAEKCILGYMGRDGLDMKGPVVFLASDASGYVTGHNLVVDGGFTVWQ